MLYTLSTVKMSCFFVSSPQDNDVQTSTKSMAEMYARRTALSMTSTVVKTLASLLVSARDSVDGRGGRDVLDSAPVVTKLVPHVFASVANLARADPHSAVQILGFIQELLPSVAALNNLGALGSPVEDDDDEEGVKMDEEPDLSAPHYAWVESDHPYKYVWTVFRIRHFL